MKASINIVRQWRWALCYIYKAMNYVKFVSLTDGTSDLQLEKLPESYLGIYDANLFTCFHI